MKSKSNTPLQTAKTTLEAALSGNFVSVTRRWEGSSLTLPLPRCVLEIEFERLGGQWILCLSRSLEDFGPTEPVLGRLLWMQSTQALFQLDPTLPSERGSRTLLVRLQGESLALTEVDRHNQIKEVFLQKGLS